jgi:putative transcriptional regulator
MPVRITLDAVLADRGLKAKELARAIGMSETQLSLFRSGKVRGIRFSSLAAIYAVLECRPGDLLDYDLNPADVRTQLGEDTAAIT